MLTKTGNDWKLCDTFKSCRSLKTHLPEYP